MTTTVVKKYEEEISNISASDLFTDSSYIVMVCRQNSSDVKKSPSYSLVVVSHQDGGKSMDMGVDYSNKVYESIEELKTYLIEEDFKPFYGELTLISRPKI
jgi:hypothetical protein